MQSSSEARARDMVMALCSTDELRECYRNDANFVAAVRVIAFGLVSFMDGLVEQSRDSRRRMEEVKNLLTTAPFGLTLPPS